MDLLALIGKAKPKGEAGAEMPSAASEGPEREYAREAFSALQDGDEEGFIEAFIGAVKACTNKASSGGYDTAEE